MNEKTEQLELEQRIEALKEETAERKGPEGQLRNTEEFNATLLNNAPMSVLVLNPDYSIRYVNPALEKLTGFSSEELVGRTPPYPWWPEDRVEKIQNIFEQGIKEGIQRVEEIFQAKSGERFWVEITSTPVRKNGQLTYYLSNWVEITERKEMEASLIKSSEKIKLFAYSVCHDLKNPAIATYGLAKLLHKQCIDSLDEKGKSYCEHILKASEQIAALVEKINVFVQTKEAPLTTEKVKLREILQIVREEFSGQLTIRQIEWAGPEQQVEMWVDRVALLRVLRNLVDNSLKYGGDDLGQITIRHEDADEFHILSVQDDGVGMKKESCEKIFEVFKRDETSRGIEGTGLGLAIVKEIAERHGGRVWVEPGQRTGITFHLSILKYLL
jgi:PAS domain S-box-containing protein